MHELSVCVEHDHQIMMRTQIKTFFFDDFFCLCFLPIFSFMFIVPHQINDRRKMCMCTNMFDVQYTIEWPNSLFHCGIKRFFVSFRCFCICNHHHRAPSTIRVAFVVAVAHTLSSIEQLLLLLLFCFTTEIARTSTCTTATAPVVK